MKKTLLLLIFFLNGWNTYSQNLIPNPSFEDTIACPTGINNLNHIYYWFTPTNGSPDYFNPCTSVMNVSVPHNVQGFQYAHGGDSYVGITLWEMQGSIFREYIEVQIDTALVANKCYHFQMYCNHANRCTYTVSSIGAYFSDTLISGISGVSNLLFTPQIENDSANYLDTLSWTLVSGNYAAHGGENYIIIGNFKNDSNTVAIFDNGNGLFPYVYSYIDDVSLIENEVVPIDLGNDTTLCQGEELLLNATSGFQNYVWQDSSTAQTFLFNDTAVGNYNLNLTALDSNGCDASGGINVSVEICEGISTLLDDTEFLIYPNPAYDYVTVTILQYCNNCRIEMTNTLGEIVQSSEFKAQSLQLDIHLLPTGVYFIMLHSDQMSVVKKLVKL